MLKKSLNSDNGIQKITLDILNELNKVSKYKT